MLRSDLLRLLHARFLDRSRRASAIRYTDDHLQRNSSALWSDDPKVKATEKLLVESGPETIRQTVEEKRQVELIAQRCLAKMDREREKFSPDRYRQLRGYFEEFQQQARISQIWARAYFALRWYRNTRQAVSQGRGRGRSCC